MVVSAKPAMVSRFIIVIASVRLGARFLDDLAPQPLLAVDVGGVFGRRTGQSLGAFQRQPLADLVAGERVVQRLVETGDDRGRGARGSNGAITQHGLEA